MAGNPYGANRYRQASVQTATPGQVLLMLYEGAIKNVKKASECLDRKDIPGKGLYIGKTHDIVNELVNTLNFEVGGDIARDLERLYNFMIEQLIKANSTNSKESLQAVQKLLETLLDGWRGAVEQAQRQPTGK